MRLKSFYAKTMTEAMQMVRDTLGDDAIIIATREENGGRAVRVTAAVEQQTDRQPAAPAADSSTITDAHETLSGAEREWAGWLDFTDSDREARDDHVQDDVTDLLIRHNVPDEVSDPILSCVSVLGVNAVSEALALAFDNLYNFIPLPRGGGKTLFFVGPAGAGKTLAIAKVAAAAVLDGKQVALASADTVRAGGVEQLDAFARLMTIPLARLEQRDDLPMFLQANAGADLRLVDTFGVNPFLADDLKQLGRFLRGAEGESVLVLPAGLDAAESGDMARLFAALGVKRLLASRVDTARRLGGLLTAAHHGGMAFAGMTSSARPSEGPQNLSPADLTALILRTDGRALDRKESGAVSTVSSPSSSTRKAG